MNEKHNLIKLRAANLTYPNPRVHPKQKRKLSLAKAWRIARNNRLSGMVRYGR